MKKKFFWLAAIMAIMLVGCADSDNASSGENNSSAIDSNGQPYAMTSVPEFKAGDIYAAAYKKTGKDAVYTEYFSFTNNQYGEYSEYKDKTRRTYCSFTYHPDLGVCSVSGKTLYVFAAGGKVYEAELRSTSRRTSMIGTWEIGIVTATFNADGTVTGSNTQGKIIKGKWKNNNGFIDFVDENDESDNARLCYSSDGYLYEGVRLLQRVSSVGEVPPLEAEISVPQTDSDGVEYADVRLPTITSGIYGCKIYASDGHLQETDYYDFSNNKITVITGAKEYNFSFEKSVINEKILKIYVPDIRFTQYMLQVGEKTLYVFSEIQIAEKTDSTNSLYGSYTFTWSSASYTANMSLNKNGSISGKDKFGDISGTFAVKNGIVTMVINAYTSTGTYESTTSTGLYYYDGSASKLVMGAHKLLKANSMGGELYAEKDFEEKTEENSGNEETEIPTVSSYKVGDIICSDGSIIRSSDGKYTIPKDKKCMAVIFQISDGGKSARGIGLNQVKSMWSEEKGTGYYKRFPTNSYDGSKNWEIICAYDVKGSSAAETVYPLFHWANTYGTRYYPTSEYSTGWYIPSENEFKQIYANKTLVEAGIKAAGGTELSDLYWTSCQYAHGNTEITANRFAVIFRYSNTSLLGTSDYRDKSYIFNARAAYQFFLN